MLTVLQSHLLSLILLMPIGGAAAMLCLDRRRTAALRWLAMLTTALVLVLAGPLWFRYDPMGEAWQLTERAALIPSWGVSYFLGVDGFSVLLVLVTGVLGLVAVLASWHGIGERVREYYACLLLLQATLLGALVSLDALLCVLFSVAMMVPMYLLSALWGAGRRQTAAVSVLLHTAAGSAALLVGVLAVYVQAHATTGIYSFDLTAYHQLSLPRTATMWIAAALLAGFAVRIPMVPLHTWLVDACSEAPPGGSVLIAGASMVIGGYGLVRFVLPILPVATRVSIPLVSTLALAAIAGGAALAWRQTEWPRMIGYAIVSHMGMMTLGCCAITPAALSGSLLEPVSQGAAIAGLLVIAAVPVRPIMLFLPLMTLATFGVPGELMILRGVFVVHPVWAVIAGTSLAWLAACLVRAAWRTLARSGALPGSAGARDTGYAAIAAVSLSLLLAAWIAFDPAPFLVRLEPTMARVLVRLEPGYAPAYSTVPGCGSGAAPTVPGPLPGFSSIAPCDAPK